MTRNSSIYPADRRILLLSAGMLRPKKLGNPFASWHRYLNYGLLGLATRLAQQRWEPRVFHGHFDTPRAVVSRLAQAGWMSTTAPILLSIPSSYALPWAAEACKAIKQINPEARIVVGGRWVVAQDGEWIRKQIPDVDLVVYGLADDIINQILVPSSWTRLPNNDLSIFPSLSGTSEMSLSELDYGLLERHHEFTPSFEVSRGCGRSCSFCAEASVPLSEMKCPQALAHEISTCQQVYGGQKIRAFFEASMFLPQNKWISDLQTAFNEQGIDLKWRTETRVDHLSPERVASLADCGMRVLDLGLESASPRQLERMNKTQNPKAYLRKASELLKACHDEGVWPKVNVLLYPGESAQSLSETDEWLDRHARFIKGVSAGPMILYRYGPQTIDSLRDLEKHGASSVCEDDLEHQGFTHLHLSEEMSHEQSLNAANRIARKMMTARDYFDLKSFSYFPPERTYEEFMQVAQEAAAQELPFSMS